MAFLLVRKPWKSPDAMALVQNGFRGASITQVRAVVINSVHLWLQWASNLVEDKINVCKGKPSWTQLQMPTHTYRTSLDGSCVCYTSSTISLSRIICKISFTVCLPNQTKSTMQICLLLIRNLLDGWTHEQQQTTINYNRIDTSFMKERPRKDMKKKKNFTGRGRWQGSLAGLSPDIMGST